LLGHLIKSTAICVGKNTVIHLGIKYSEQMSKVKKPDSGSRGFYTIPLCGMIRSQVRKWRIRYSHYWEVAGHSLIPYRGRGS
jgi:hypothetical protein